MKGITLVQPWASLVALGAKCWETRSWQTDHAGALLIHASKRQLSGPERRKLDPAFVAAASEVVGEDWSRLPYGKVLSVAKMTGCVRTVMVSVGEEERLFGDYSEGRFAWRLEPLLRLDPLIPARGALALWIAPWPVTQAVILQRDPLCTEPTCGSHSAHVDHKVARTLGGLDTWGNLRGMCAVCHGKKTAAERRGDTFQFL